MPETAVAHIAFPRRMLVTMRRCRGHETVAVLDTLPVPLAAVAGADAPIALRNPKEKLDGRPADVRVHGGRFYMPVDLGRGREGLTPEAYGGLAAERLAFHHGNGIDRGGRCRWDLADWKDYFTGVSRKRPFVPEGELDIQAVHDDGRAEQARMVEEVRRDWILVDGRLHQRVEEPSYAIGGFETGGLWLNPLAPMRHEDDPSHTVPAYERFRADRAEDAIAFGRAWSNIRPDHAVPDCERFEILRPDLVAAASRPDDPGLQAQDRLRTLLTAAAPCIGHCDDACVEGFLALRRIAGGPVPDRAAAERAMAEAGALVDAVAGFRKAAGWRAYTAFDRLANEALLTRLRHEAIDRPRMEQAEDAADLAVLAP